MGGWNGKELTLRAAFDYRVRLVPAAWRRANAHASTLGHAARRRGTAYVLFLGTSLIVLVTALASIALVQLQRKSDEGSYASMRARFLAQSAIEYGFALINANPDWAANLGAGQWLNSTMTDGGTVSLDVTVVGRVDSTIKPDDSIALTGVGTFGEYQKVIQMTLVLTNGDATAATGSWKRGT